MEDTVLDLFNHCQAIVTIASLISGVQWNHYFAGDITFNPLLLNHHAFLWVKNN